MYNPLILDYFQSQAKFLVGNGIDMKSLRDSENVFSVGQYVSVQALELLQKSTVLSIFSVPCSPKSFTGAYPPDEGGTENKKR